MAPILSIQRLHPAAQLPFRAYPESAAYDLSALLLTEQDHTYTLTISPQTSRLIPTGLALRPPPNHCILICSRSGLAKDSIFVTNAPGVIDPDYTGEIKVLLYNGTPWPMYVKHEQRIAQALIVPFAVCAFEERVLSKTERGERGFGSSGQ